MGPPTWIVAGVLAGVSRSGRLDTAVLIGGAFAACAVALVAGLLYIHGRPRELHQLAQSPAPRLFISQYAPSARGTLAAIWLMSSVLPVALIVSLVLALAA
jgi:hypothetical protein